jgi:hypothetical protein
VVCLDIMAAQQEGAVPECIGDLLRAQLFPASPVPPYRHQGSACVSNASSSSGTNKYNWRKLSFVPFKELPGVEWPQAKTTIRDDTPLHAALTEIARYTMSDSKFVSECVA